jgi:hypothetical protein
MGLAHCRVERDLDQALARGGRRGRVGEEEGGGGGEEDKLPRWVKV